LKELSDLSVARYLYKGDTDLLFKDDIVLQLGGISIENCHREHEISSPLPLPLRTYYHYHKHIQSSILQNQAVNAENATATIAALAVINLNDLLAPPVNSAGGADPVAVSPGKMLLRNEVEVPPTAISVAPGPGEIGVPDTVISGPPGASV
jgi:hypothetical protein